MGIILEAEHLTYGYDEKRHAIEDLSIAFEEGKTTAILGANGAGKSTLMKIIMGLYQADKGQIYLDEKPVTIKNPIQAMEMGISMVAQELNYVPELSVEENLFLGRLPVNRFGKVEWRKIRRDARQFLKDENLPYEPTQKLKTLTVSDIQMLEIIKAVTNNAQVIIMDEPTSSITDREVENLFRKIEELKAQGISIIYISHKMEEVFRIADDITVLRDGAVVSTDRAEDLDLDTVIARMVGRKLDNVYPKETVPIGDKALEIKDFSQKDLFEDINFHVAKGEIVGFAGLVGAGRTETMRAIFGLDPHDSGQVFINGKEAKIKCPHDSIQQKMVMLSESRRDDGIIPVRSVMENASLASLERIIYKGYTHKAKEKQSVKESFEKMHVKTPTLDTAISTLSGGNQQKVILGRWLLTDPDILLLDEPTRGIDVGAKFEIYQLINQLAEQGKGIIVVSSEMPELFGISDRILVMSNGHQSAIFDSKEVGQVDVMQAAARFI